MKVCVGRLPAAAKATVVAPAAAAVVFVLLSGMAALPTGMAAVVEHTFVVSESEQAKESRIYIFHSCVICVRTFKKLCMHR